MAIIGRTVMLVERAPPALARVALYIAQNPEKIVTSSIADIGHATGSGQATVLRFCQALGYDGFRSFKLDLVREIEREQVLHATTNTSAYMAQQHPRLVAISNQLQANLRRSAAQIDPVQVAEIASALKAAGRVAAFGKGVSGVCADIIATRLVWLGITVHVPQTGLIAGAVASNLSAGDIAIGISYSGLSQDSVAFLQLARDAGARTVGLTIRPDSVLAKAADIVVELAIVGPWPQAGSARLIPSVTLFSEFLAEFLPRDHS